MIGNIQPEDSSSIVSVLAMAIGEPVRTPTADPYVLYSLLLRRPAAIAFDSGRLHSWLANANIYGTISEVKRASANSLATPRLHSLALLSI